MLPPLALIQQRCVDPCPGRFRSPLHDSSRTIDAYSSHHRFSSRSHERYDQRVAYSDVPAHWRRPLSRESPPSRHLDFTSKSISHLRGASPHGEPRRLRRDESPHGASSRLLRSASITALPSSPQEGVDSQWRALTTRRVASRGSSSHGGPRRLLIGTSPPGDHHQLSGWDSLQSQDLTLSENPFMGICVLQDAPTGNSSLHREIPIRPDVDAMRRETLSPLNSSTHFGLLLKIPVKGSLEAYLQDPLITIRVVIFASWRMNFLVQSLILRANTLALVFIWIMAPISAILHGLDVWLILLS